MSTIQQLADYNDLCGGSPIWDARGGNVYWTRHQRPEVLPLFVARQED